MPTSTPSATIDAFVVHTPMEWHLARSVVELLAAHGYTVGASQRVEHPGCVARAAPVDARATIVIWPLDRGLSDMLEREASAAVARGVLVQIYAGRARPSASFAGSTPIDFTGWDYTHPGGRWAALLSRLRPLCGPPRTRPVDTNSRTQAVVLNGVLAITVMAIAAALVQGARDDVEVAAPDPQLMAPVALPISNVEDVRARVHPGAQSGGPDRLDDYKIDVGDADQGIDVAKLPQPDAPVVDASPVEAKRAPQGPEM